MRLHILVFGLILFFSSSAIAQESANSRADEAAKGKQIIDDAQKKIGADKLLADLGSFQLSMKSQSDLGEVVMTDARELSVSLPDKIRSVYTTTKPFESIATSLWNGEKYKKFFESVAFDGQRTVRDVTKQDSGSSLEKFVKDKETLEKIKKTTSVDPKARMNDNLWNEVFPFVLSHPFETQAEFRYAGKAQSANGEASIVDTTSASGRKIRLFFDAKTNQLLMMIEKYKFFDGDYENKYYYTNRELTSGVLIPKKIKVERKFTPTGKEAKVTYAYIDVVDFKINPKFKPNLFDVN